MSRDIASEPQSDMSEGPKYMYLFCCKTPFLFKEKLRKADAKSRTFVSDQVGLVHNYFP